MNLLQQMMESLRQPQSLHAAMAHLPIALSLIGVPLLIGALALPKHRSLLRTVALIGYLALAFGAWRTAEVGELAEGRAGKLSKAAKHQLHDHEEMGEKVQWFALGVAALLGLSFVGNAKAAVGGLSLATVGGLATAGWVAVTGHHGGTLVYQHGIGTPGGNAAAVARDAGEATSQAANAPDPRLVFWRSRIGPLFAERCVGCHADGERPGGGLDMTTMRTMLSGGENGPALAPGRPDDSLLWQAVAWKHATLKMPFGEDQLPAEDAEAIRKWIAEGAAWEAKSDAVRP